MATEEELDAGLASLKTELDAAKARDQVIQDKLTEVQAALADLIAHPPATADLTDELQSVSDAIAQAQTIGQPPGTT